ncbi:hypothetical protein PATSB16_38960 [Pandoraea thiooxydans]|nr:hypothetical protein PATSB16_38960 [Pandoraea thiooxydans]
MAVSEIRGSNSKFLRADAPALALCHSHQGQLGGCTSSAARRSGARERGIDRAKTCKMLPGQKFNVQ